MAKISAKNNEFLKGLKMETNPKVYSLLVDLVREDREDLAEIVIKIDHLLEYSSICIKQRDLREARETLSKAKDRIDMLKKEGANTEFLDYLYEGIYKKVEKPKKKKSLM